MTERRKFLKEVASTAAACMLMACRAERLLAPARKPIVTPDFFGHMVQAEWVRDDGMLCCPVSVYFGTLRLWDSRAVWWKLWNGESYDWTGLEANLVYSERVGADVMFTFGLPPAEMCLEGTRVPHVDAWEGFVRAIVARAAGRVRFWEGPNEPVVPAFWGGSPEQLAQLERIRYQVTKELAPGSTVLSASIAGIGTAEGYAFADRYLAAGGGQWCDEISIHAYAEAPDLIRNNVAATRALLEKHRVSRPIRNTEYNITQPDPALRSPYMAQSLVIQASLGLAGAVVDPETDETANDYTDDTISRTAHFLIGTTVGEIRSSAGISRCVLSRDGGPDRELVWTERSFPSLTQISQAAA